MKALGDYKRRKTTKFGELKTKSAVVFAYATEPKRETRGRDKKLRTCCKPFQLVEAQRRDEKETSLGDTTSSTPAKLMAYAGR